MRHTYTDILDQLFASIGRATQLECSDGVFKNCACCLFQLLSQSMGSVTVAARQVSVCLVSKSDAADQQKMLNVEAKPFVPESLKVLFERHPSSFVASLAPHGDLQDKK